MKKLKIVLILLTLMFQFSFVHASTVVIGPTENVGVFWIDPNIPNLNTPASYQKWGQVFTAADNYLETISFYLRSGSHDNDATYFKIDIREWSDVLSEPIGQSLYESPQRLFSSIDTSGSSEWGTYPTVFPASTHLTSGNMYIAEIVGDGIVGMNTTSGYSGGGLYEYTDKSEWCSYCTVGWHEFGNSDLRSDMVFSTASPVPLPSSFILLGTGLIGLAVFRKKIRGS